MLRRHTDIDNFHSSLVPFTRGDGSKGYLLTSGQPLRADVWPPITEDRGTSDCAQEGGTFRTPAPDSRGPRIPRRMVDLDQDGVCAALCIVVSICVIAALCWGGFTLWGSK